MLGSCHFPSSEHTGYRFGFQGQEKDDEIHNVDGSSYDFGARLQSPRLGRWWSTDPLASKYPALSPYAFAGNSPIKAMDSDGRDIVIVGSAEYKEAVYLALLRLSSTEAGYNRLLEAIYSEETVVIGLDAHRTKGELMRSSKTDKTSGDRYSYIAFNPWDREFEKGGLELGNTTTLDHELGHWLRRITGKQPDGPGLFREWMYTPYGGDTQDSQGRDGRYTTGEAISPDEVTAVHEENILRAQMGLPLRRYYGGIEVLQKVIDGTVKETSPYGDSQSFARLVTRTTPFDYSQEAGKTVSSEQMSDLWNSVKETIEKINGIHQPKSYNGIFPEAKVGNNAFRISPKNRGERPPDANIPSVRGLR